MASRAAGGRSNRNEEGARAHIFLLPSLSPRPNSSSSPTIVYRHLYHHLVDTLSSTLQLPSKKTTPLPYLPNRTPRSSLPLPQPSLSLRFRSTISPSPSLPPQPASSRTTQLVMGLSSKGTATPYSKRSNGSSILILFMEGRREKRRLDGRRRRLGLNICWRFLSWGLATGRRGELGWLWRC